MTPDRYCTNLVAATGSNLYYSLLFVAAPQRRAATAVHALAWALGDVPRRGGDPGVVLTKLQWWREEIARAWTGAPRHPITQALHPFIATYGLSQSDALSLLDAVQSDSGRVRDANALHAHAQRVGGIPQRMAAQVFGATHPDTLRYADTLGVAVRLTEIISELGADVRRGRLYLPLDELHRFGVDPAHVLERRVDASFTQLMAHQVERTLQAYDDAEARLPHVDRAAQLPGLVLAQLGRALLAEIRRDGYAVLERRLALTPLRKLWIALKTRALPVRAPGRAA